MPHLLKIIVTILAIGMAVFHLYSGGVELLPATQQRAVHLGLALALIFLLYPLNRKKDHLQSRVETGLNVILAVIALACGSYIYLHFMELAISLNSPSFPTVLAGVGVILLTLEASRRILGWSLPIIALFFFLYAFFGNNLPLMIAHSGFSVEKIITQVGLSDQGILGIPLGVSATYIVLFIIFGAMLEKSGAGKLFIDLAMAVVGKFRGGAAKVSVVASALFGSISGSQVANVATTGVLTIPLMKKGKYSSQYAGAVESVASTGGMFLPPVMGAVSFLIADFLQVSYASVIVAAIVPAVLYFFAVFIMVDLRASRVESTNLKKEIEVPEVKKVLRSQGHLLLPLILLVYFLLILEWAPPMAGFWAVVSIPVVSWLRKHTRMTLLDIKEALEQGVKLSLLVAAATACAGIVIGVINMTGMGLRFSGMLVELSGQNLIVLLVLTMVTSVIMGMGLPPVASYVVLAVLAAPAMIDLGVHPMAAHLFIFYYGTLSAITPPVAFAAYAASGIAGSDPMRTSFTAVRLASTAFIIPFMFVTGPALILEGQPIEIAVAVATSLLGVFALAAATEGYIKGPIMVKTRFLMLAGALLLLHVGTITDVIGVLLVITLIVWELIRVKMMRSKGINVEAG
ncbi:TRAP transporter, 4TM/12TM fusion protein [Alteribacillus persepolensis]|uniref:TRAP transporter, 4TM/12TM fusion protein n=1 Tax=Alteribacillus persepolensis TaxID=568899 RepID=A0A1G8AB90_9BACI|nr:TRAP transporter permease [Alteribacillus persepolensis]SDH17620.1 TRAP transporter, 4TM/12TM fusion protein [Alteribacillus persepolensis]